jgi:hypothetical protein
MADAGLDPAFVVLRVLTGVLENDLYIITHSELRTAIAGRFDQILAAFDKSSMQQ